MSTADLPASGRPAARSRMIWSARNGDGANALLIQRVLSVILLLATPIGLLGNSAATRSDLAHASPTMRTLVLLPLLILPVVSGLAGLSALLMSGTHRQDPVGPSIIPARCALDTVWRLAALGSLGWYLLALCLGAFSRAPDPVAVQDATPNVSLLIGMAIPLVTAVPLALPPRARYPYILMLLPLQVMATIRSEGAVTPTAFEAPVHQLAYDLFYVAATTWVISQADHLDLACTARREQELALAAEQARSAARRTFDDFVHDHILAALVPVARHTADRPTLRRVASMALTFLSEDPTGQHLPDAAAVFAEIERRIRTSGADLAITVSTPREVPVPPEVALTLADATGEAIINSLHYAGGPTGLPVPRRVEMSTDRSGIHVAVHDEGCGFSLADIPRERRGISSSIVSRMEGIGGHARIISSPGAGCTVELHWPTPALADGRNAGQGTGPGTCLHREPRQDRTDTPVGARRILWSATVPTFLETRMARHLGVVALLCQGVVLVLVAGSYTRLAPALLTFLAFAVVGPSCSGPGPTPWSRRGWLASHPSWSARATLPSSSRSPAHSGPATPHGRPGPARCCVWAWSSDCGRGRHGGGSD